MDLLFTFSLFFIIFYQIEGCFLVRNESIFKPNPLPDFLYQNLIVIPADVPSRILRKMLTHQATQSRNMLFSHLFYFSNHVVLYGGIGAPGMVLSLEPLLVSGIKRIIFLGLAGSLTPRIALRSAVVVDTALSEEGTSRHYFPERKTFSASLEMRSQMEAFLTMNDLPYAAAAAVSTDAPYRETPEWVHRQVNRGYELVDMEISAVFALSEYYHVQAGALMLISDQLSLKGHDQQFHDLDDCIRTYFYPFIEKDNKFFKNLTYS
jgi:purine-nucleoside phosphorylase